MAVARKGPKRAAAALSPSDGGVSGISAQTPIARKETPSPQARISGVSQSAIKMPNQAASA